MSSTGDHIKQGVTWTWAQVRRALLLHTLLALLVTLCGGFGFYWYASYKDIAARMEERLPAFEESLDTWIKETATTFSEANPDLSESPRLPSRVDVREIQENVTNLISNLNAVPRPTQSIENAAADFHRRLSDIVREIGRYDGTAEATTKIVYASNEAARAGDAHNQEIENYLGSTLKRLLGAF